jgi:hypothetical protein
LVLDVDFADAEGGACASGTRDFSFENGAVFLAFFFDVFFDFCRGVLVSDVIMR